MGLAEEYEKYIAFHKNDIHIKYPIFSYLGEIILFLGFLSEKEPFTGLLEDKEIRWIKRIFLNISNSMLGVIGSINSGSLIGCNILSRPFIEAILVLFILCEEQGDFSRRLGYYSQCFDLQMHRIAKKLPTKASIALKKRLEDKHGKIKKLNKDFMVSGIIKRYKNIYSDNTTIVELLKRFKLNLGDIDVYDWYSQYIHASPITLNIFKESMIDSDVSIYGKFDEKIFVNLIDPVADNIYNFSVIGIHVLLMYFNLIDYANILESHFNAKINR